MTNKQYLKIAVALLAAAYFFYYAATPYGWHFIDNVNLIIHEAGHWIFWPFGMFMHILGGSLNQVLVPIIFVVYFYLQNDNYSAALVLFWVGQNLINVSVYAGDAVKMQLPLLGGEGVIHDWNWLLIYTGQLHHTDFIAGAIRAAGIVVLIIAAIWSITSALSDRKIVNYG
jgi:hypothetical protein